MHFIAHSWLSQGTILVSSPKTMSTVAILVRNTIGTDVPLQVLGLDKSIYGYTKQSSNEQPIECEDPPS